MFYRRILWGVMAVIALTAAVKIPWDLQQSPQNTKGERPEAGVSSQPFPGSSSPFAMETPSPIPPVPQSGGEEPAVSAPSSSQAQTSQKEPPASQGPASSPPAAESPAASSQSAPPAASSRRPVTIWPSSSSSRPASSKAPASDGGVSDTSFAQQVVNLVNEERAKAGLKPLSVSQPAAQAAQVRAREIETSFSHTRPDGTRFFTALAEQNASYRTAGENIAWGQRTPQQVMDSWMNSQGHRANILNAKYTAIGVGHYKNASGAHHWTQIFIG